ncbi:hypothetical protein AB0G19_29410 [Streptomyces althioticus]|uniref:hypothetical protein n=1 Tax=Streptomyces althioticus TaxID=83380 RepID=UPI00340A49C5
MDLPNAAALLTTHAQHAYTLQREAGAALTLGTQSDPRRLARLAHRAERAVELAVLWDGVLWEAHGTDQRDLFPLAYPARLVAAARTLRTLTRDGITRAYDLTCEEFPDRTPERAAGHWAARLFLLHTNIVDHLPGAATAPAVLAELRARLSDGSNDVRLSAGTTAALELVTTLRKGLDAAPVAARDIPACAGEILIRALKRATFQGCSLTTTDTDRTAGRTRPPGRRLEDRDRRRRFRRPRARGPRQQQGQPGVVGQPVRPGRRGDRRGAPPLPRHG